MHYQSKNYKIYFCIIFLLLSKSVFAQDSPTPVIKSDLPQVTPPSPTVAAFMKFEEVPVSNYTGVPNISIPIFSSGTTSKDVGVNLSLSYHPASAAVDAIASDVGLGWSFFGGGTISRTVRGYPDESTLPLKMGMHQSSNKYQQFLDLQGNSTTPAELNSLSEYMFNAGVLGQYDTEYDLYQYNFLNYSGRFYLKLNGPFYEVVKLDNSTLRITYDNDSKSFTILDDKGNKYLFDVTEVSRETSFSLVTYLDNSTDTPSSDVSPYISAYHLSSVSDPNGQQLIGYVFNDPVTNPITERTETGTTTTIEMTSAVATQIVQIIESAACNAAEMIRHLEPKKIIDSKNITVTTRKLTGIVVQGKAKIQLVLEQGRSDYNLKDAGTAYRLKEIVISEYNTSIVGTATDNKLKKFTLTYDYSNILDKGSRMILKKVTESNFIDAKTQSYELFYNTYINIFGGNKIDVGKDYWGYYNLTPNSNRANREAASSLNTNSIYSTDMLQKMILPTGGSVLYDFEPNTYSYVGSTALDDKNADLETSEFNPNPDNWSTTDYSETYVGNASNGGTASTIIPIDLSTDRYLTFTTTASTNSSIGFYQGNSNTPAAATTNTDGVRSALLKKNMGYSFKFSSLNGSINGNPTYGTGSVFYSIKTRIIPTKKWLYGGGVRIRKIGYFESADVTQYHYITNDTITPAKEKNYNYQFYNEPLRSSGSLVYAKPMFTYMLNRTHGMLCERLDSPIVASPDYTYRYTTSFNNLQAVKTQGGDVGYKNVKVYETGNGRQEFTYTSPIDVPEDTAAYTGGYPFVPVSNHDYKRGLITNDATYSEANLKLLETNYEYDISSEIVQTGLKFFIPSGANCPFAAKMSNWASYKSIMDMCASMPNNNMRACKNLCGYPTSFVAFVSVNQSFGWVKLISKTTKEYSYSGTTLAGTVQNKQSFTYNELNKKIASQTTDTYNTGSTETINNTYTYLSNSDVTNNNRISEIEKIETRKNGSLINSQKIIYDKGLTNYPGNYLPITIQTAKANEQFENRVQFLRYDKKSNPTEVKKDNNNSILYVWGYYGTELIAVIENVTYPTQPIVRSGSPSTPVNIPTPLDPGNPPVGPTLPITTFDNNTTNDTNTTAGANSDPLPLGNIDYALIAAAQDASDSGSESNTLTALTALRNSVILNGGRITTYTYKPLCGISTVTDPKGYKKTYTYDSMLRLEFVKDDMGRILSENKYNFRKL